jgi:hypothetical protein
MAKRYFGLPAVGAAVALLIAGLVGAGAASGAGPVSEVFGVLGLGATPGDIDGSAVSAAVGDAIEPSTPGKDPGDAVMLAACPTVHDRSTLPPGAQAAPGQKDKEAKACDPAKGEKDSPGDEPDASLKSAKMPTHGQAIRDAVHAAQASSALGASRGAAVSVAACTAAHDRTTLPEGAQNAPGRQDKEAKDCSHPIAAESDTTDTEESLESDGAENGKGRGGGKGGGKPDQP